MLKIRQHIFLFYGLFIIPFFAMAQEDVVSNEELIAEQRQINFDTFFFEALQQKAIGNFDKAIYALEECNNLESENLAVLFEFSKNYYQLSKYTEAEFYAMKALEISPKNLYLLQHLKDVNLKQNDIEGAVKAQNFIIAQKPELESDLIFIYLRGGKIEDAKKIIKQLDEKGKLPKSYISLKESLLQSDKTLQRNTLANEELLPSKLDQLKKSYRTTSNYETLKQILEREYKTKQFLELEKDSKEAISLYPAQAYVYLMNGIALNNLRKCKEAIDILDLGIEFVVENPQLEARFMEQLSLAYKSLGNNKTATFYYNKMLALKQK
ncbi:MAG: hypothetical protein ABFR05_08515 [Bacteroidota bacterium]